MAFFEKLFRKPEPPRVETDPRKEEFAARQAKFKELIGKATSFDVLFKLIEVYMKDTKLNDKNNPDPAFRRAYTKDELIKLITDVRKNDYFSRVPKMLGLQQKVKELTQKEIAHVLKLTPEQRVKHSKGEEELRKERAQEEASIENVYRDKHPVTPEPPVAQERRPTLEDMKWQVYKLFDTWNGFGEQYHLKRMPEASVEQRTHYSNVVNLKEFAEFVVQDYEETFGPGGRQRAVIDLKTFFDKTVPAEVDKSLDFLGIQETAREPSFAEILTKDLPQELKNRTMPVRELVAYWNTYSNQDRQFHLLDDFTNTEQKIDLATFAVFVMGKYAGDVKRLQEDWNVFVAFLERVLKERDAI